MEVHSIDLPLWKLKKQVCDIGHRIWLRGYCGGNEGNHSVRISDDRVLCTPTNQSKGFLEPEDLCLVDMDGKQVDDNPRGRKRSSEVLMHLAIYKHRPDIKAVVHSHPPHATAFAIANIPIPEGIHPEAEVFLGRIPFAPYATPSKPVLGESVVDKIGPDTNTVVMANHGTVSFDKSLTEAYYKLEILDAYCRVLLLTRSVGIKPNVLNPAQMTELLEVKEQFGMHDDRLACSPEGCASPLDQPFFTTFDNPATAAANDQGSCQCETSATTGTATPNATGDAAFEQMVQTITNQIMATSS
jgi:L-fuculose-phosphate aldolase